MASKKDEEKLTPKEAAFAAEFIIDLNVTQSAIRAGYSKKTARVIGQNLMRKPRVQKAIEAAQAARAKRTEITQDRVLREYGRLGFSDMRHLMSWDEEGVKLKDSGELSDDVAPSVAEVVQTITKEGGSLRIKLHDKKGALDSICRLQGWNKDKLEHSGPDGGPIPLTLIELRAVEPKK